MNQVSYSTQKLIICILDITLMSQLDLMCEIYEIRFILYKLYSESLLNGEKIERIVVKFDSNIIQSSISRGVNRLKSHWVQAAGSELSDESNTNRWWH